MSDPSSGRGKVVVNRALSLDGFISGPRDAMDWIFDSVTSDVTAPVAARTGAMLVGRRTWDVGDRMAAEDPRTTAYPFDGPTFLLTHRPPDVLEPGVSVLSGDIAEAVATALEAAAGKDLELLGADVAGQALRRGLVDEILVYVVPVVLGDGVPFVPAGSPRVDLEPISSSRSGDVTILRFRVRAGRG